MKITKRCLCGHTKGQHNPLTDRCGVRITTHPKGGELVTVRCPCVVFVPEVLPAPLPTSETENAP